jgi:hypothetical protein
LPWYSWDVWKSQSEIVCLFQRMSNIWIFGSLFLCTEHQSETESLYAVIEVCSQDTAINSFCGFVISKNYDISIFINTKMNLTWNSPAFYCFIIHNKLPVNGGYYATVQGREIWIVNTEVNMVTSLSIVWKLSQNARKGCFSFWLEQCLFLQAVFLQVNNVTRTW